jgi:hypothetical protein
LSGCAGGVRHKIEKHSAHGKLVRQALDEAFHSQLSSATQGIK